MGRECHGKLSFPGSPFAYFDEIWMESWFPSAKADAEASFSIQFL
ncbi:hypothetical protein GCM10011445_29210 [Pseudocitrobacter faecalis]|nr:hypothetical protein GCM10011445_29210 [Pseudocitrobacter faecalis]